MATKQPQHDHKYTIKNDDDTQECDCGARQWFDGSDLSFPHPDERKKDNRSTQ